MAKAIKGAVSAELSATGVHRIDGQVTTVDDQGVVIMTRVPGRRVLRPVRYSHSQVLAYTDVGPGFVVLHGPQIFDPIAGTVQSVSEGLMVIQDATTGINVNFNTGNACGSYNFAEIAEDDRALGRSSITTKTLRSSEKADKPAKSTKAKTTKTAGKVAAKKSGRRR
jgi:hypothetical protein